MDSTRKNRAEMVLALYRLVGKPCWGITGVNTGTMASLDFGDKIPRPVRLRNPHLTPDQQQYAGEIGLFIKEAAWRLDSRASVICGSLSSNHEGGPKHTGLSKLLGRRVTRVKVAHPGLDVTIGFEGGLRLQVFCDRTNTTDESDNYSVHLADRVYSVRTLSQIECLDLQNPRPLPIEPML